MPVVNQIRLCNISLEDGDKLIPNQDLVLQGLTTLYLLENGGGKTSFIQLFLQTILPNTTTNQRSLQNTVARGTNGHIAIEWNVDEKGLHKVLTGFSYDNPDGQQDKIKHYMYVGEYKRDQYGIRELPFFQENDGRKYVTGYEEFRQLLKRENRVSIKVYHSGEPTKYKREIESHGIIPAEWESIKKINVSEGAADKFFEKTTDVENLLTKLFIPSIEEALFTSTKESTLAEAFEKFQENLFRLPEIQKNIKDFEIVEGYVDDLIHSVHEYNEAHQSLIQQQKLLLQTKVTLHHEEKKEERNHQNIQLKIENARNERKHWEWKKDSFEIYKLEQVKQATETKKESIQKDIDTKTKLLTSKNRRIQELEACQYYEGWKENTQKADYLQEKLDSLKQSNPELEKKVDFYFKRASFAWTKEKEQKKIMLHGMETKKKEHENKRNVYEIRQKELRVNEKVIFKKLAQLEQWWIAYDKKREKILKWFNEWDLLDPHSCFKGIESQEKAMELEINDLNQQIKRFQDEEKQCNKEIIELNTKIERYKQQVAVLEQWDHKMQDEKEMIVQLLSGFGLMCPKKNDEMNEQVVRLQTRIQGHKDEVKSIEKRRENVLEQIKLIEGRTYFVPHEGLLKVKEHLSQKNIHVVLGSEWLSLQEMKESDKHNLLLKFPALPYALLMESSQNRSIAKALQNFKWQKELPILFLERESLIGQGSPHQIGTLLFLGNDTWMYHTLDVDLFVNPEKFIQKKNQLEEDYESLTEQLAIQEEKQKKAEDTLNSLHYYWKEYPPFLMEQKTKEKKELNHLLIETGQQLELIEENIHALNEKNQNNNIRIEYLRNQEKEIERQKTAFDSFLQDYEQEKEMRQDQSNAEKQKKEIQGEQESLINRDKVEKTAIEELESKMRYVETELKSLESDKSQYRWIAVHLDEEQWDYDEEKRHYIAKKSVLEEKQKDRKDIEAHLSDVLSSKKQYETLILKNQVELDWLHENYRPVTNREIIEIQKEVGLLDNEIQQLNIKSTDLKMEICELIGQIKIIVQTIDKKYNLEPYSYETGAEYNYILEKLKEEINNIAKLELEEIECKRLIKMYQDGSLLLEDIGADVSGMKPLEGLPWGDGAIKNYVKKMKDEWARLKREIGEKKENVEKQFAGYCKRLKERQNPKMNHFIRSLELVLSEGRLFDYDYVTKKFVQIRDAIVGYRQSEEKLKQEGEKDQERLLEMCYRRVNEIYDIIKEIPKSSKMNLYDQTFQAIKLSWDANDIETTKERLREYIHGMITEIKQMREEGKTEDEMSRYILRSLEAKELMESYAPYSKCRIQVFKPKKKQVLQEKVRFENWEVASKWSGGEKYTVYMIMFMVFISHLRQIITGREKDSYTILVDNPFGQASNDHVVDPVIEIAKGNKIQLICLTAHDKESIIQKFPVVYSNVYRQYAGKEIMETRVVQTLESLHVADYEQIGMF